MRSKADETLVIVEMYNVCFSSRNQRKFVVLHTARYELNFIHRSFSLVSCSHAVERSRRFIFQVIYFWFKQVV